MAKESTFSLPPKGTYIMRAPDTFTAEAFTQSKQGALVSQIDPTIAGPTHENFVVKFTKVSAKVFDRNGSKVSQVGDYLKACGFEGKLTTPDEIAAAVESTAGRTYSAKLDWRGYNKRTGWSIEGMERFPKVTNADGTTSYQSWIVDPSEVGKLDENGRQLRVLANLTIPFGGFIAAA